MDLTKAQLQGLDRKDYCTRFKILTLAMHRIHSDSQTSSQVRSRLQGLMMSLEELDGQVKRQQLKYSNKKQQVSTGLSDLETNLEAILPAVESQAHDYESQLMEKWRTSINRKNESQATSQEKELKDGSSNSNLMFMSAQIIKSERVAAESLNKEKNSLNRLLHPLEDKIRKSQDSCLNRMTVLTKDLGQIRGHLKSQRQAGQERQVQQIRNLNDKIEEARSTLRQAIFRQKEQQKVEISRINNLVQLLRQAKEHQIVQQQ